MPKTYYIDSENVGDSWIELLQKDPDSRFLIFYTGHSPRIDYSHAISLMNAEKKPKFIRCYEGNNGLDFQLVSYLGYQLCLGEKDAVIVSDDTGFDTVISFWTERGMSISRISAKSIPDISMGKTPVSADKVAANQPQKVNELVKGVDKRELFTIINCMGPENTTNIHHAFVHFYGTTKGEEIYKIIKQEGFVAPPVLWTRATKIQKFVELAIRYCNEDRITVPDDLIKYLCSSVTGNDDKKSMKQKISAKYGDKASSINKILSPHYIALSKIS